MIRYWPKTFRASVSLLAWTMVLSVAPSDRVSAQEEPSRPSAGRENPVPVEQPDEEKLFSGPQVGEPLPELPVWMKKSSEANSEKVDLSKVCMEKPIAIAFMHEKSRPAFGLARLMSAFAEKKKDKDLQLYFVVLSDDRSETEQWLGQIGRYFNAPTQLAVADGGIEGPGTLGLNRMVSMTILVANKGKVTANFALTQVSNQVDGPKVLEAMNEVSGGGDIPSLEELLPTRRR